MASKLKSFLYGEAELPEGLTFLERTAYYAIRQRKVGRKVVWHVEVDATVLERLVKGKAAHARLRVRASNQKAALAELRTEIGSLREALLIKEQENALLNSNNERLRRNIEEDSRPDKFKRSPKSYLNVAEERGFKSLGGLPLQGGLAGLEKK